VAHDVSGQADLQEWGFLHRASLVQTATKRSAHRKKRPRRPMVG
jgi:hypothetical protein